MIAQLYIFTEARERERKKTRGKKAISCAAVSRDSPFSIVAAWPAAFRGFPGSRYTHLTQRVYTECQVCCRHEGETLAVSCSERKRNRDTQRRSRCFRDTQCVCVCVRIRAFSICPQSAEAIRGANAETKEERWTQRASDLWSHARYLRTRARGAFNGTTDADAILHKTRDFTRRP